MDPSSGYYIAMGLDDPGPFMKHTYEGLNPFTTYLAKAIKALENKEVSCTWDKVEKDRFVLKPLKKVYKVIPETLIELEPPDTGWFKVIPLNLDEDESFDPDPDEPLRIGRGRNASKVNILAEDKRKSSTGSWQIRPGEVSITGERISWSDYEISLIESKNPLENDVHDFRVNGQSIHSRREKDSWKFWVQTDLSSGKTLEVNGMDCKYRVIRRFNREEFNERYPDNLDTGPFWKVASEEVPQVRCANVNDITDEEVKRSSIRDLLLDVQSPENIKLEKKNDDIILSCRGLEMIDLPSRIDHRYIHGLSFSCQKKKVKDKWIQLLEPLNDDENGPSGSTLEHFFSENVSVFDSGKFEKKSKMFIIRRNYEEKQLLLSYNDKGPSEYPHNSELHLKADTGQIINQKKTVYNLQDYPFPEHRPLLELFQLREEHKWPVFEQVSRGLIDWKVLTDLSFNGCEQQREFVCKALATPDFAIMSGPPGTGKTTTILELILQMVQKGERVLLAASTHAAINNVLERLQENGYGKQVHATRVGLADRAAGLEDFVFDRQADKWQDMFGMEENDARRLVIESANLVCGTTMGIHSLLRNRNMGLELESNGAPFDVMIIDECSKTTFHEFLVPARLAKKWILVGDIRQLSPFTDREQITSNLDSLNLSTKKDDPHLLSPHLQEACKLLQITYPYKTNFIVPVSSNVALELKKEIDERINSDAHLYLQDDSDLMVISDEKDFINLHSLYTSHVLFVEENLLVQYREWMPADSIILEKDWLQTAHAFRHFAEKDWHCGHDHLGRGKVLNEAGDIHKQMLRNLDSSWSEEVCWRLEREYWLRLLQGNGKSSGIKKQLERLFPCSVNATGKIYKVVEIAFPSVLESLSGSGMTRHHYEQATTLNQGFSEEELECRHTVLSYQHRMHPDISELPRELFYSNNKKTMSLLDGERVKTALNWDYKRYGNHRVWLDIKGSVKENANDKEAVAIDRELEHFCKWAKEHPKDDLSPWEVAVLTFYKGQERCLRDHLKKFTDDDQKHSRFEKDGVKIKLATVDFFQGQEADIVFLSMVNTNRDGFLDSPNRLNVAITRARYQLVIVGYHEYFAERSSAELKQLAKKSHRMGFNGN